MARRKREPVYSVVDFSSIDGLEGCTAKVWCNFPIRLLDELNERDPGSIRRFLAEIIHEWTGFNLPCNAEGIGELTLDEITEMVPLILAHITNPQMRSSGNS